MSYSAALLHCRVDTIIELIKRPHWHVAIVIEFAGIPELQHPIYICVVGEGQ